MASRFPPPLFPSPARPGPLPSSAIPQPMHLLHLLTLPTPHPPPRPPHQLPPLPPDCACVAACPYAALKQAACPARHTAWQLLRQPPGLFSRWIDKPDSQGLFQLQGGGGGADAQARASPP